MRQPPLQTPLQRRYKSAIHSAATIEGGGFIIAVVFAPFLVTVAVAARLNRAPRRLLHEDWPAVCLRLRRSALRTRGQRRRRTRRGSARQPLPLP
jgi:hypothetical protein